MAELKIGDMAPDFSGTAQDGATISLSELKGTRTVLYFYPKDNTSGCTLEAKSLRDGEEALKERGYRIARNGVSNYTLGKNSRVIFLDRIPDHTDDIHTSKDIPSWKRMCYCILKNDHMCRFMGFGLTREEQKRVKTIKEQYGELINDK